VVSSVASYLGGALVGFAMGLLAMLVYVPWQEADLLTRTSSWLVLNMGQSIWLFGAVLAFYGTNLMKLQRLIAENASYKYIVQLDQLSDVWIHLFIGIGVIWTAIGMRSALSTTLNTPTALVQGAGEILSRLVDGGILLALTTTIVGAIGGYLMQLMKTISLGAKLTEYYHVEERKDAATLLSQLSRIEIQLEQMSAGASSKPESKPELVQNG
jgi:hypothetical protein